MTWGTRGAAVSEALVKGWVRESLLQRSPSQQEPCKSMFVQGLVVPLMVQEGRWQVRMYTGAEKLPGKGVVRRGQEESVLAADRADLRIEMKGSNKVQAILEFSMTGGAQGAVVQLMVTLC